MTNVVTLSFCLVLLLQTPVSAQRVECDGSELAAPSFERVLCALRTQKFVSTRVTGHWRDLLRHDAMTIRDPEKAVPKLYQLAIGGDREGVELAWMKRKDRLSRFFIAMLYYAQGGGEFEATTAFRPLPLDDLPEAKRGERRQEIELVAKYRSALAAELVDLLKPFTSRFWVFEKWEARASDKIGEPLTPGCLNVLVSTAAPN